MLQIWAAIDKQIGGSTKRGAKKKKYGYFQISGFRRASFVHRNLVCGVCPPSTYEPISMEPEPSHGDLLADRLRRLESRLSLINQR